MKKINSLVLSTITAAFLVGCGGGSSDSGTAPSSGTTTDVTVERGPVLGASVTDSNGQVATQKSGTNVYSFATTPAYPITASGGIIDVDGNGIDEGDIELTSPLMSYSTVITPITNYLSTGTSEERQAKLTKLKEITGVTNDDDFFKKVPSEVSDNKVLVLTNTLYDLMNDDDTSNDNFITDYDNSAFKTKFAAFETQIAGIADKKEIAKALEEKVIENLGITPLTANDVVNLPTTSTLLKISDLTRYVSYDKNESWFDDNTLTGDKLSFKAYDQKFVDGNFSWELEDEEEYVTITKDATNPYKLSFVDPITKEEGTFTILSTKKQKNYTDLYKTKAQIVITKKGTVLNWDKWNWDNPSYWENNASVAITDIDGLEKRYLLTNAVFNFENDQVVIKSDGKVYLEQDDTKDVGTWKKEDGQIIINMGKETVHLKVVSEDNNYYIEEASNYDIGFTETETMYTGTNLDDFITDIKAPSLEITSADNTVADENQTSLYFADNNGTTPFKATIADDSFVIFSLAGDGAKHFKIDSDGIVTFKTAPDFETKKYYSFDLVATDKVGKESSKNIQVKINDLEDTVTPPVDETIFSKSDLVGKKLVVENETLFFEENRVVLGDSGEDYTTILSYSSVANNKIILSNGDIIEKASGGYKITFEFGTLNQEIFPALSLGTYTSTELNDVLSDVEQISTPTQPTSFISGKKAVVSDLEGSVTATFNTNGNYSESFGDRNCSGKWKDLGSNKIGVTCEDNGTTAEPTSEASETTNILQFGSNAPAVNDTVTVTEPSTEPYLMTIDSITNL